MRDFSLISKLPPVPAVYALYGVTGQRTYVAYVGKSTNLKDRIEQHFIRRDSSVTTGVSAASLNPNRIAEIRWWRSDDFSGAAALEAAEEIAFQVLNPTLRSRGQTTQRARTLLDDPEFRGTMSAVFDKEPAGKIQFSDLSDAIERISDLEERVRALEEKVRGGEG